MALRYTAPYFLWVDGDGVPAADWFLYFYTTGTDTPLATYSNAALTVANTNPVQANADGYWGPIYLQATDYKVVLKDADGATIWTADPVSGAGGGAQSSNIRTTTISSAITVNDGTVIVNAAGATTQTLPTASTATGRTFTVKNINTGTVTVAGTIDAATNYSIPTKNQSASFQSNGSAYIVV
jgi:hypothetical protein